MGHKVFIYAPHAPKYKDKGRNVFRFQSIKVIKKPEMRLALPFFPKNNIGRIADFKLDIAHAHTPFSMGLLAKYIAENQKIPLVYTHHTHYPEYAKCYIKEKVITPFLAKLFSTWYSNSADAVIAPSYKMERLLIEYGVRKPIHILPTGINLNFFKKTKAAGLLIRKRLNIPKTSGVIIFVGRMGKEKNPEFLLESMAEILKKRKDVILLMVGDGPYLKEFQKLSQNLKIQNNVIFTRAISHKEIPAYYQASDAFVFASLTDTQGIVILEAMACGLPIVALKDDAFKEMVIENKNGFLVKKLSPKIFGEKVLLILNNSNLQRKLSFSSKKIVKDFSELKQAKKLLSIYKSLIEN